MEEGTRMCSSQPPSASLPEGGRSVRVCLTYAEAARADRDTHTHTHIPAVHTCRERVLVVAENDYERLFSS